MSTNIYVGNLSFQTDSDSLKTIFSEYGEVNSAQVIADRQHRPRALPLERVATDSRGGPEV